MTLSFFKPSRLITSTAAIAAFSFASTAFAESRFQYAQFDARDFGLSPGFAEIGDGSTGADITGGYTFTVSQPDIFITELAKHSFSSSPDETLTLYNFDTGEVLASFIGGTAGNAFDFYELDAPIETEQGITYAIIGFTPEEASPSNFTAAADQDIIDFLFADSPIDYQEAFVAFDEISSLDELQSSNVNGLVEHDYGRFQGLAVGGLYGLTDVGTQTRDQLIEAGVIAAPTPVAATAGLLSLTMLTLRRKRDT
ncbi:hypothetical protein JD969_14165 [Planctomycetota bacterium]|nr:hypothetical protein JD969_14165 [Planctomycetota bacterium]